MYFSAGVLGFLCMFSDRTFAVDPSFVRFVQDAIAVLFPPVRVSAHLCGLRPDDSIHLSRTMSRAGLSHEIHRDPDEFGRRMHDTWDHQILYVLDLDCDFAIPMLRTANASGMFGAPIRWLLLQDRTMPRKSMIDIAETFRDMAAYPDSDVTVAEKLDVRGFTEITSVYRPSPFRDVVLENRGNWTIAYGVRASNFHAASRRRRNLQGTPLKSCIVMTDPDTINHLNYYENVRSHYLDPIAKINYAWIHYIVNRMNATVSFRTTNTWGYREQNGSWSGMIGMLQRKEIDLAGTGMYLVPERIGVIDYVQLYTRIRARFIFRQPLLSTVSNIFALPFERSVWMALGVFLVLVLGLLYCSSKWEHRRGASSATAKYWSQFNPSEPTLSDNCMVILGAVAQQGYSYEPYRVPSRIVTLMLLIAALSLYASYTANIVALLQSNTDTIKTLADLLHSPLKLGAHDVIFARYYFKSFQDPIRRAIVDEKIESSGTNGSWMTMEEGVRRMRNELFGFHTDVGPAYMMMQDTYQEEEKCGITEIDIIKVPFPLLAVQARSPYSEIVKSTALLLRETGLKFRAEKRLYTERPECRGQTGFISIGFTECNFVLASMGYGTLLSLLVLAIELLWQKKSQVNFSKRDSVLERRSSARIARGSGDGGLVDGGIQ